MKNILIIIAHPKKDSFTFAMADVYTKGVQAKGYKVVSVELYQDEPAQPFLTLSRPSQEGTETIAHYQKLITDADEITLFFPYWWGSYPAILHNFFDQNLTAGFAFKYTESSPKGLLTGKKLNVFTTTGAPERSYEFSEIDKKLEATFGKEIAGFCGMELGSFNMFGGINTSARDLEGILQRVADAV